MIESYFVGCSCADFDLIYSKFRILSVLCKTKQETHGQSIYQKLFGAILLEAENFVLSLQIGIQIDSHVKLVHPNLC